MTKYRKLKGLEPVPRRSDGVALAVCELLKGERAWIWKVLACPFCGGVHTHGGGWLADDPRGHLGHRVAHCGADGGYVLVEPGNGGNLTPPTRQTIFRGDGAHG